MAMNVISTCHVDRLINKCLNCFEVIDDTSIVKFVTLLLVITTHIGL